MPLGKIVGNPLYLTALQILSARLTSGPGLRLHLAAVAETVHCDPLEHAGLAVDPAKDRIPHAGAQIAA